MAIAVSTSLPPSLRANIDDATLVVATLPFISLSVMYKPPKERKMSLSGRLSPRQQAEAKQAQYSPPPAFGAVPQVYQYGSNVPRPQSQFSSFAAPSQFGQFQQASSFAAPSSQFQQASSPAWNTPPRTSSSGRLSPRQEAEVKRVGKNLTELRQSGGELADLINKYQKWLRAYYRNSEKPSPLTLESRLGGSQTIMLDDKFLSQVSTAIQDMIEGITEDAEKRAKLNDIIDKYRRWTQMLYGSPNFGRPFTMTSEMTMGGEQSVLNEEFLSQVFAAIQEMIRSITDGQQFVSPPPSPPQSPSGRLSPRQEAELKQEQKFDTPFLQPLRGAQKDEKKSQLADLVSKYGKLTQMFYGSPNFGKPSTMTMEMRGGMSKQVVLDQSLLNNTYLAILQMINELAA